VTSTRVRAPSLASLLAPLNHLHAHGPGERPREQSVPNAAALLSDDCITDSTAYAGELVGADLERLETNVMGHNGECRIERKSSQYFAALAKDQEIAQRSLRLARQLCRTPSSPIPLGMEVFCKPPGNPRGLFLGCPRRARQAAAVLSHSNNRG
jgi:hypothetical protein